MYNFTRSDWSIEATDRKRERLKTISDAELLSEMVSANHMCSPGSYWGQGNHGRLTLSSGSWFAWRFVGLGALANP